MQTIVELPEFIKRSKSQLEQNERISVINYLAAHPLSGDLIKGTGGLRKLRWAAKDKGKSGSVRLIYYYHSNSIPLFILTVFAKNEKDNLSKAECNELAKLTKTIVSTWGDNDE